MSTEHLTKAELISRLRRILHRWHVGTRPGNDGNQGNTLEDLLEVPENNLSLPDFGEIEIKTQKAKTDSLITLFHMEPSMEPSPAATVPRMLLSLGWRHQDAGTKYPSDEMSFRSTTYSNRYTSRVMTISFPDERVLFKFDPSKVETGKVDRTGAFSTLGEWLNDLSNRKPHYSDIFPIYYDREKIERKCIEKLDHTLFVTCKTRKRRDAKEFFFDEAHLLKGFSHDRMTEIFADGGMCFDFDARTGHNHGTKIRVAKNRLKDLFIESESIT